MSGGDTSDFTPDGLVIEGLREGILAALQRDDLDPEDRKQLEAALKNLDSDAPNTPGPPPPQPTNPSDSPASSP